MQNMLEILVIQVELLGIRIFFIRLSRMPEILSVVAIVDGKKNTECFST